MQLVNPPSHQANLAGWVILLICFGVIVLFFLGLGLSGPDSPQSVPVAVDAVPQRALAEPAIQAAPGPAGQEQERMLVRAPAQSAPAPAPTVAPAARPVLASARKAPAAAARMPVKHLVVTRHLGAEPSHTAATFQTQVSNRPAEPVKPAAQEAPEGDHEPQAEAAVPATSTRYGVTTRTHIMGQAAGPVYNLNGRSRKPAALAPSQALGSASGATGQVQERQDGAEAAPEEK